MQNRRDAYSRPPKQLPPWLLAVIDIVLIGVCLVIFALFDHVIPRADQTIAYTAPTIERADAQAAGAVPSAVDTSGATGAADAADAIDMTGAGEALSQPDADAAQAVPDAAEASAPQAAVGDFSARFADKFTSGEVIRTDTTYQSPNLNVALSRLEQEDEEGKQVIFVADIYIRNIECLNTIFAKDTFGRSITENVITMSNRAGAVVAINADFYSHGSSGIVIRNGELYRRKPQADQEVLIIYRDGTMKTFSNGASIDLDQVMADGAWQAFSFGPSLLDGNGDLRPTYAKAHHDPRTILGMIEPGHYLFIVVDGRQGGYSRGMTLKESAQLAHDLGCAIAYNLDGGKTSQMTFMGAMVNHPYANGRPTSDLICITDVVS